MQCPKCSSVNPPEAKFCGKCGERIPPPPPAPPLPIPPEEGVSEGLKIGMVIGSIILPLVGIIMGAIYMNNPSPAKKKVGKLWLFISIGASIFWCLYTLGTHQGTNFQGS